jgi:hypothetical protein
MSIGIENKRIDDQVTVANEFNKYFLSIADELSSVNNKPNNFYLMPWTDYFRQFP